MSIYRNKENGFRHSTCTPCEDGEDGTSLDISAVETWENISVSGAVKGQAFVLSEDSPLAPMYKLRAALEGDVVYHQGAGIWINLGGIRGPKGAEGPVGQTGATGQVGQTGATGQSGLDSTVPGPQGLSAYEVAVTGGFSGTEAEWLISLEGPAGESFTLTDGLNTTANGNGVDVDLLSYGSDAAALAALGVGFLYIDPQGNVRKSGDGDAVVTPSVSDQGNIILNGQGQYGDNTYFNGLTANPALAFNSQAAFVSPQNDYFVFTGEQKLPIIAGVARLSLYARGVTGEAATKLYVGLAFFDSDDKNITHANVRWVSGSKTTLAAPLSPGDTTITLTDGSSWDSSLLEYNRRIAIGGYTLSSGQTFDNYSQHVNTAAGVNRVQSVAGNVITLENPWQNPPLLSGTIPAGTDIWQSLAGGSYKYCIASNQSLRVDGGQSVFTGLTGGNDPDNSFVNNKIPTGAAYAKIVMLMNWGGGATGLEQQIINSVTIKPEPYFIDKTTGDIYITEVNNGVESLVNFTAQTENKTRVDL